MDFRIADAEGFDDGARPESPGAVPETPPMREVDAWAVISYLLSGVIFYGGIGWLLDRWLGISPWGLIVFLLLGFAAGVLNVMRAAGVVRNNNLTD